MRSATAAISFAVLSAVPVFGQVTAAEKATLPVREITLFKDGHAFVVQQGKTTIDPSGRVRITQVPNPVLGTFWPYAADKALPLKAVTAGREPVTTQRDAVTIGEFLQANIGSKVKIERTLNDPHMIEGTVLSLPVSPPSAPVVGPGRGGFGQEYSWDGRPISSTAGQLSLVLLQTESGVLPLPLVQINSVLLPNGAKARFNEVQEQGVLSLQFGEGTAGKTVDVGMMYLQKGLRWIPNYKVNLDGKGNAEIALQGTLINDLIDFTDIPLNLVVGVPNFAFKDTPDPIGVQDMVAQLSRYFTQGSPTGMNFSNAIMTQGRMGEREASVAPDGNVPEFSSAERNEDLYLFAIKHASLKRGQRMTLPIANFSVPYRDVYTLELPPVPPQAIGYDNNVDPAYAKLFGSPAVKHQARLQNNSVYPLTTAPALLMRDDRVLAQSLMTYTATGGQSDLFITNAVDVSAKRQDVELKRTSDAQRINNMLFSLVELKGSVTVTNYRRTPIELEISRYVVGDVTQADGNGTITVLDPANEPSEISEFRSRFGDYSRYNKLTKVTWKPTLTPGQTVTFTYLWNYIFR